MKYYILDLLENKVLNIEYPYSSRKEAQEYIHIWYLPSTWPEFEVIEVNDDRTSK